MQFSEQVASYLHDNLGADARRDMFVSIAGRQISEFEESWRSVKGASPDFIRIVDGQVSDDLDQVKIPGGVVSETVNPGANITPIVIRALELLGVMTKVVTGDYASKTHVFRNGQEVSPSHGNISGDHLVLIGNISAFAREAEQRPFNKAGSIDVGDGLFETIAAILKQEFKQTGIPIYFTYQSLSGDPDDRVPLIAIGVGAQKAGQSQKGRRSRRGQSGANGQGYQRAKGR